MTPLRLSRYRATPERLGWALVLGIGVCASATVAVGWHRNMALFDLIGLGLVGALLGGSAIVLLGGPLWWAARHRGQRGPVAAGAIGALVTGGPTFAAVIASVPERTDAGAVAFWVSAAVTALVAAFLGTLLALAMWLVGYRTVR